MKAYTLQNLDCADCARRIEDTLRARPGVRSVSVDFATLSLHIDADDMKDVARTIRRVEPEVRVVTEKAAKKERRFVLGRELSILGAGALLFALAILCRPAPTARGLQIALYAMLGAAYVLSGWNVLVSAVRSIVRGRVFSEHFLMTIATGGALAIGSVTEAVAVMIFYKVGEILEDLAVDRSRRSIGRLLELRPDAARIPRDGGFVDVSPEEVDIGQEVLVRPGERVPLDGTVVSGAGFVDTSALTGEPVPRHVESGKQVLAGFMSVDASLVVRVSKTAGESSTAKIIQLVENATHAKARTERFITRFAAVYTPIVVVGAALVAFAPPLFAGASLYAWVYRALTMLVISCPCALMVSVPLGYFGGIGGLSRHGILVKGAKFIDALAAVKTVVFDKTGTVTRGVFRVLKVQPCGPLTPEKLLTFAAVAESHSNHPIAASIREAAGSTDGLTVDSHREIGGFGVAATAAGHEILVGSDRLMHREQIAHGDCDVGGTAVHVAVDGRYAGYLVIGDELKEDAKQAVRALRDLGIRRTVLLTGDDASVAARVAQELGADEQHGDLLPQQKVEHLEKIMAATPRGATAVVGDGINDAPILARADVGVAMGEFGSDVAVETADVVLMTDSVARVPEAVRRAKHTRAIVVQNIVFALAVKAAFLGLGALGVATMWEAVVADMGVALVAILNATRAIR